MALLWYNNVLICMSSSQKRVKMDCEACSHNSTTRIWLRRGIREEKTRVRSRASLESRIKHEEREEIRGKKKRNFS